MLFPPELLSVQIWPLCDQCRDLPGEFGTWRIVSFPLLYFDLPFYLTTYTFSSPYHRVLVGDFIMKDPQGRED